MFSWEVRSLRRYVSHHFRSNKCCRPQLCILSVMRIAQSATRAHRTTGLLQIHLFFQWESPLNHQRDVQTSGQIDKGNLSLLFLPTFTCIVVSDTIICLRQGSCQTRKPSRQAWMGADLCTDRCRTGMHHPTHNCHKPTEDYWSARQWALASLPLPQPQPCHKYSSCMPSLMPSLHNPQQLEVVVSSGPPQTRGYLHQ